LPELGSQKHAMEARVALDRLFVRVLSNPTELVDVVLPATSREDLLSRLIDRYGITAGEAETVADLPVSFFSSYRRGDLAAEITSLQAQIAALAEEDD